MNPYGQSGYPSSYVNNKYKSVSQNSGYPVQYLSSKNYA